MPIRRGLIKVKEIKDAQRSGGENTSLRFVLGDGETSVLRFYGNFEEEEDPIIGVTHYVRRLAPGHQYHNCCDNLPEGQHNPGCVFCYSIEHGDKNIKKQNRAYFWVKDHRKSHKLDQEVRVLKPGHTFRPGVALPESAYRKTKYPPCSAPKVICQYCKAGNKAELQGYRHWELAVQYSDQVLAQQTALRTFCHCGGATEEGEGTLQVSQYVCGNPACGQPVDFDPNQGRAVASCHECRKTFPPNEVIECTNCENPERTRLQDWLIKVTRTGGGTDTTYNFEAVKYLPVTAEDLKEALDKRPDFEAMLQPEPPGLQASHLGVMNPFQEDPGHGADQYEEQPAPRRTTVATTPRPAPKPAAPAPKAPAPKVQIRVAPRAPTPAAKPALRLAAPTAKKPLLLRRAAPPPPQEEDYVDYQ